MTKRLLSYHPASGSVFGKTGALVPFIGLVCLFIAAPTVAAGFDVDDPLQDAQATVQEQQEGVQAAADTLQQELQDRMQGEAGPAQEPGPGPEPRDDGGSDDGEDGSGQGGEDRGGRGEPTKEARSQAKAGVATVQDMAAEQAEAAEVAAGEAVGLVDGNVVKPVKQAAEGLQTQVEEILTPEEEAEPAGTRPAAQAATTSGLDIPTPFLLAGAAVATAGGLVAFWLAGSSGSAGLATTSEMRRVLPGASPLFTRFEKDTVLGHPKRERLYASIMQEPGITLQDLCTRANLSRTAVTHHLRLLEQQHLVVSKRLGRSRHYYENGGRYGRDQKEAYAVLQNERSRDVASFIQGNPGAIQKHICEALGIQASVAHWHVRRLQEANLVEPVRRGRTVSYFPSTVIPTVGAAS